MIRSLLAASLILTVFAPALVVAQPGEDRLAKFPDLTEGQTLDGPMEHMLDLMQGPEPPTEQDFRLLTFAYMENAGQLPVGFTRGLEQEMREQPPKDVAPTRFYRDMHLVCDLDEDGVRDIVVNQINRATGQTSILAFSGASGINLWQRFGTLFVTPGQVRPQFGIYSEPGFPHPQGPYNFGPTIDVNEDGVCDFIIWGASVAAVGIDPRVVVITFTFEAVNGSYPYNYGSGSGFWTHTERSTFTYTFSPDGLILNPECWQAVLTNFVTAFDVALAPFGGRHVIKTTDAFLTRCEVGSILGGICPTYDWRTQEHIQYRDSKDNTLLWQRDLNTTREDDVLQKSADPTGKSKESRNNITYLTGMVQLAGNDEFEVVLHQFQFTTPRTCNLNNPLDNRPLFQVGTAMTMLALRGERGPTGGTDLWRTQIYDSGTYRVNLQDESPFAVLIWVFGQILPDMNGDNVPEVFASYLMQERNSPTTTNGAFRTHVHPLDGKSGKKLLPTVDMRAQGWGYSASMSTDPNTAVPYFALGTADMPSGVSPGGRFPPKDVRLTVFDITDGSPLWSWREQFSQDTFMQFDMTLNQYLNSLAPNDYNGDGLRELLTPAQYVSAYGANQTLLSQAEHFYQTLDGKSGEPVHHIKAWGPTGVALTCKQDDGGLMIFSGHSRRIDGTRVELGVGNTSVTQAWRFALYNNPDFAAATQGIDIVTWGNECIEGPDGRIAYSTSPEFFSSKRGLEIRNVMGFIGDDAELIWQLPPVAGKPPMSIEEILRYFEIEEPSNALTLALTAGPIAPGIAAGIGLSRLRARKGGL